MWKLTGSIRYQLYISYALLIVLVTVIYVGAFYLYESRQITTRSLTSINELSLSLSNKLDLEIQKLDNVTLSVAYSNLIKDRLLRLSGKRDPSDQTPYSADQIADIKELSEIMVAAIGPTQSVRELTIYDFEGNRISTGAMFKYTKENVTEKPWYEAVIKGGGGIVIGMPQPDDELAKSFVYFKDKYFISLFRTYFGGFGEAKGIIKAQQDAATIFSSLIDLERLSGTGKRFYVMDESGYQLYPYDGEDKTGRYYFEQRASQERHPVYVDNPINGEKELVSYHLSEETGWLLAVVTSKNELFASLKQFTGTAAAITLVILIVTMLFSYYAAQKITKPIARLHSSIKKIDLNGSLQPRQHPDSGINEIEALHVAFQSMQANLQNSVDKLLYSQSQEISSKMAALTSQMNPHFLFNTITTVSIMAEEGMSEEIARLCQKLSSMLRYISSEESNVVSLGAEIDYTSAYLECMKIRYQDDLTYTLAISDELMEIPISKLIIQPLVENCMKHAIHVDGPWRIKVEGYVEGDEWRITVSDNGPGMSEDKRRLLNDKIDELEATGRFPGLSVDGMGLLNIYFRLKFTYGEQMMFMIDTAVQEGFSITIGGPLAD
ncbi:sensor histidine kinase [Paenibacillus sp. 598K]|uniref:cache domain-containing sensor histidine kinase n=1 Tax=Paenibacillus sp. 598K TaxID=1117987 RepID=UPI000FF9DD57|nr:sensor histidine kinase [Paenibacillus sp. 598K]GBF74377.1 sensor histidine kinase [Paenibacillus sp. 598K]